MLEDCFGENITFTPPSKMTISNTYFSDALVLSGLSGKLEINGCFVPYIRVSSSQNGSINFTGNKIPYVVDIQSINNNNIEINSNSFTSDSALVVINQSHIDEIKFVSNSAKRIEIRCFSDTFENIYFMNPQVGIESSENTSPTFEFWNCQIKGTFWPIIGQTKRPSKIEFTECLFDSKTQLIGITTDTVEFCNCINIEKGMRFDCEKNREPIILKLYHTDLTNIDFDYDDRYLLYQWHNPDITRSIYEKLLVKFQSEKKLESFKRVDIEYYKFKNNHFSSFLAKIWWDYGYSKWLIIIWTIVFLLIFTTINFWKWQNISSTYKIVDQKDFDANSSLVGALSKAAKVFVFTSLIFFSLKIDFNKLSFKKTGWLLYFFVQYVFGLLCLFFIVNAILKF